MDDLNIMVNAPRIKIKVPNIMLNALSITIKAPSIMIEAPNIIIKAPSIMMEEPNIMVNPPSITTEALNITALNHLRQLWLSIPKSRNIPRACITLSCTRNHSVIL